MIYGDEGQTQTAGVPEALGQSDAFLMFQEQVSTVAPVDRPVLILGERGTGKELAASRIHYLSKRWQKPLVTLNCSALTPGLIGSELFGYEKGAFTGAASRQEGRFEKAGGGTLFLDEIGNIPMEVQEKILRVVEYGRFERVGSSVSIDVDVRIVAATNADLPGMAQDGRFKRDLLDRLSFEVLFVPPLRERKGDILFLADYFAARMSFELGREDVPIITGQAQRQLEGYPWPGNIRELKNVVERAVYQCADNIIREIQFDPFDHPYAKGLDNKKIQVDDLKDQIQPSSGNTPAALGEVEDRMLSGLLKKPFKEAVAALERYLLETALSDCRYNQRKASEKLGLSYDQLRGVIRRHGL